MYPIISLFGLSLGTYGICCVIGGALAIWLAIRNGKRFQQDRFAMLEACVWALIGGFLGAKLLYLLVSFSDIVEMFQTSGFNWNTISSLLEGGFVFYGGLLGGLAALLLYLHHFQLPYGDTVAAACKETADSPECMGKRNGRRDAAEIDPIGQLPEKRHRDSPDGHSAFSGAATGKRNGFSPCWIVTALLPETNPKDRCHPVLLHRLCMHSSFHRTISL